MNASVSWSGVLSRVVPEYFYLVKRRISQWDVTPIQITVIYLVFGFTALYFSDVILVQAIGDPATLDQVQALKGGVEVLITAGLIFELSHRSRRSLVASNDRLEQQKQELQVLHRLLRHNLRNDMNVLHGYATNLEREIDVARYRDWCEVILDVTEKVIHYTDQVNKINTVTGSMAQQSINISEMIARVVKSHPEVTDDVTVQLSLPETALVETNPMLERALVELITNAIVHNDHPEPTITITVSPNAGPAYYTELTIDDNGPGIPNHVKTAIEQRGEDELIHLDGIGLWCAYWVVTTSNGEFHLLERDPRGTRVQIRLPKPKSDLKSVISSATSQSSIVIK